jgi:hypothetical protein
VIVSTILNIASIFDGHAWLRQQKAYANPVIWDACNRLTQITGASRAKQGAIRPRISESAGRRPGPAPVARADP